MTGPLTLILIDDHEVVREGLRGALARDNRFRVLGEASTGAGGLALAQKVHPDVAVVDLRLQDMSGLDVCAQLVAADPSLRVVILSTYLSEDMVRNAAAAGAAAYVAKAAGLAELRTTLASLQHGPGKLDATRISKQLHELAARRLEVAGVSERQHRILELAGEGLTDRQIGERLYLSESTIRFHIQKLKKIFDAQSKTDLIAKAIRTGALPQADEAGTPRPDAD